MTTKSTKSRSQGERHQSTKAAEQQQSDQVGSEEQSKEKAPAQQSVKKQRRKRAASRPADVVSSNKDNTTRTTRRKSRPTVEADQVDEVAQEHFVTGVLTRGEAAQPGQEELEPGQTHRIVGEDEYGKPKIKREKFSLY